MKFSVSLTKSGMGGYGAGARDAGMVESDPFEADVEALDEGGLMVGVRIDVEDVLELAEVED